MPQGHPGLAGHGSISRYVKARCRCDACRKAWREHHRAYMDTHPEQREKARMRESARYRAKAANSHSGPPSAEEPQPRT